MRGAGFYDDWDSRREDARRGPGGIQKNDIWKRSDSWENTAQRGSRDHRKRWKHAGNTDGSWERNDWSGSWDNLKENQDWKANDCWNGRTPGEVFKTGFRNSFQKSDGCKSSGSHSKNGAWKGGAWTERQTHIETNKKIVEARKSNNLKG